MLPFTPNHKGLLLHAMQEDLTINIGTAFAVHNPYNQNLIFTCAHLVKATPYPKWQLWKKTHLKTYIESREYGALQTEFVGHRDLEFNVEKRDTFQIVTQNVDFAVFVATKYPDNIPVLHIEQHEDDISMVEIHGHTSGEAPEGPSQHKSITGNYIEDENCGYIVNASEDVHKGMSGSPVINAKGNALAIVTRTSANLNKKYRLKRIGKHLSMEEVEPFAIQEGDLIVSAFCTPIVKAVDYCNTYM